MVNESENNRNIMGKVLIIMGFIGYKGQNGVLLWHTILTNNKWHILKNWTANIDVLMGLYVMIYGENM